MDTPEDIQRKYDGWVFVGIEEDEEPKYSSIIQILIILAVIAFMVFIFVL